MLEKSEGSSIRQRRELPSRAKDKIHHQDTTGANKLQDQNLIPKWIIKKCSRIVTEFISDNPSATKRTALEELVFRSVSIRRGELLLFPSLARFVPSELAKLISEGISSPLSPLEKALLIILEEDSINAVVAFSDGNKPFSAQIVEEYTRLKWEALGGLIAAVQQ
jgi:hypothetical protein